MEKAQGVINFFEEIKGFGFIRRQKGKDVFFSVDDMLHLKEIDFYGLEGKKVLFLIENTKKGPRAKNIIFLKN